MRVPIVLLLEGTDPVAANAAFAASREPFGVWFKERAGAMMGVDFDQPIPAHPELIHTSVPTTALPDRPSRSRFPWWQVRTRRTGGSLRRSSARAVPGSTRSTNVPG
ncbi:hypothetical protein Lfu02_73480 [Longispora fulva]|nr:hypothetical protein Lfu02_73480 [Longispora fulva]